MELINVTKLNLIFGYCSKKVSNKTRQVVNSTQVSGAAERLRFIGFRRKGISKELIIFFVVTLFSSHVFFPCMIPS